VVRVMVAPRRRFVKHAVEPGDRAKRSFVERAEGHRFDEGVPMPRRPVVVVSLLAAVAILIAGVTATMLPADHTYRYRYRGFRLLLANGDRLFLVPAHWTTASATLVVDSTDEIRLQILAPPPHPTPG
jgi:hypothetical protein